MSCHQIEPFIVDLARGALGDQVRETALQRHVLGCPSCAGLVERERAMSAALRRLAGALDEPPPNPQQEQALLAMLGQADAHPRSRTHAPLWAGVAAAALFVGALVTWRSAPMPRTADRDAAAPAGATRQASDADPDARVAVEAPAPAQEVPADRAGREPVGERDRTEFVAWPGAAAWPPFESGELVRVTLPADALPTLGFPQPATNETEVQAEVLVGQDGFARAIRLIQ